MTEHRTASAPDAPVEEAAVRRALEHGRPAPHQVLRAVPGTRDLPPRARVLGHAAPTAPPRTREPHALIALVDRGQRHVLVGDSTVLVRAGEQPGVRLTLVPAAGP